MSDKKQHPSFAKSVGFAVRGLLAAAKGERNFRIQLCAFAAVVALGFLLHLTAPEWIAVLLWVTALFAAVVVVVVFGNAALRLYAAAHH